MIKELKDALVLIEDLGKREQQQAAKLLQRVIRDAEERATMTYEEIMTLRRLEIKALTRKLRRRISGLGKA